MPLHTPRGYGSGLHIPTHLVQEPHLLHLGVTLMYLRGPIRSKYKGIRGFHALGTDIPAIRWCASQSALDTADIPGQKIRSSGSGGPYRGQNVKKCSLIRVSLSRSTNESITNTELHLRPRGGLARMLGWYKRCPAAVMNKLLEISSA